MTEPVVHVLREGVADGAWQHASLAVVQDGRVLFEAHAGASDDRFDIASVTKAYTAAAALGRLDLDVRVDWLDGGPTIGQLLSHASGLPAWRPLFAHAARSLGTTPAVLAAGGARTAEVRSAFRRLVADTKADAPRPTYSDLGFLALGCFLEEATGLGLAELVGMEGATFDPAGARATGRGRPRHGNPPVEPDVTQAAGADVAALDMGPDDDNAACAGAPCGHAGLFATAVQVARFGDRLLRDAENGSGGLLSPARARMMFTRAAGSRTFGLDTPSGETPSIGRRLGRGPRGAAGHLGFTGCSLWMDLDARISVALLSDAVSVARPNPGLKRWRPRVHDAVADAIGLAGD